MATPDQIPSDLTLEIETNLSPDGFLAASRNFFGLVEEIASSLNVEGEKLDWYVKVREGSNLLAIEPANFVAPEKLQAIYTKTRFATQRLMEGDIDSAGLSEKALGFARGLSQIAQRGARRTFIQIWIEKQPVKITSEIASHIQEYWRSDYHDYGTIEGRLEAIQDTGGLQIKIRDYMYRTPVKCILPDTMLDDALGSFRRRVEISGTIHYRKDGSPISISAEGLTQLPDDADLPSANDVRGILAASA